MKPILQIVDGRIAPLEKVRTAGRALARLEELAVAAAADRGVEITVCHLAELAAAQALADKLAERLADDLGGARCGSARCRRSSARTSAPAWSASRSRPAEPTGGFSTAPQIAVAAPAVAA